MARKRRAISRYAGTQPIYGPLEHPLTGEKAPEGKQWVRHALTGEWVLEEYGTPWCCSCGSETYFCS